MAKYSLAKRMYDPFVVVLDNFHRNYEIAHWRWDIDDDDKPLKISRHCMLMDRMMTRNWLLKLFLIELYHLELFHMEMKMLVRKRSRVDHREIYHLERVMEQVHDE